jgi:hypothetical protein
MRITQKVSGPMFWDRFLPSQCIVLSTGLTAIGFSSELVASGLAAVIEVYNAVGGSFLTPAKWTIISLA